MPKRIMDAAEMDRSLTRIAHEIIERNGKDKLPALVGIRTCGEYLAKRLSAKIKAMTQTAPPLAILDINLYRDDLTRISEQPVVRKTIINFEVDDLTVILVDDVIYTGRTARCGLDAIMDFGRPKAVQLAVLIDRGHRELPIKPDFVGKNIPTQDNEIVHVHLTEKDPADEVIVETKAL